MWAGARKSIQIPVLVVALTVGFVWSTRYFSFMLDDPYISFRYARNLALGNGLVFNVGERVEGYTNFLWVVLMAAVLAAGADPVLWSKIFGVCFHLATIAFLWLISRDTIETRIGFWGPAMAAGLLAVNWYSAIWAVGGLETSMFTFLLVAGLFAYFRRSLASTSVVLFLASITRPEGVGFFLLLALVEMIRAVRLRSWRPLISLTVPFTAGSLAFFSLRFAYYGELLPNTFYAKTGGPLLWNLLRGFRYVASFTGSMVGLVPDRHLLRSGPSALVAVTFAVLVVGCILAAGWAATRHDWGIVVAGAWVVGHLAYLICVGGDWMPGFRFVVPIIPFLALTGGYAFARLDEKCGRWGRTVFSIAFGGLIVVGSWGQLTTLRTQAPWLRPSWRIQPNPGYYRVADWLQKNTAPEDWIAVEEAGLIPYFCDRKFLDLFGLTDKRLARTGGQPPFGKRDDQYVLDRAPDFVVLWTLDDPNGTIQWAPHQSLMQHPEFREKYHQAASFPRGTGQFLVFQQRDGGESNE